MKTSLLILFSILAFVGCQKHIDLAPTPVERARVITLAAVSEGETWQIWMNQSAKKHAISADKLVEFLKKTELRHGDVILQRKYPDSRRKVQTLLPSLLEMCRDQRVAVYYFVNDIGNNLALDIFHWVAPF